MQALVDVDLQLAAVEAHGDGESPPRSTWATAAPQAPVPEDIVSPTPRSKIRARMASGAVAHQNETFVRFGNSGERSIPGPIAARSRAASPASSATRIAHWGLPTWTCWKACPATSPRPSEPPAGKSADCRRARPMSILHVAGPRMVGRISPAAVWIENVDASVHPARRR